MADLSISEKRRAYRAANAEKINAARRARRLAATPEEIAKRKELAKAAYLKRDQARVRAEKQRWKIANREKTNAAGREYYYRALKARRQKAARIAKAALPPKPVVTPEEQRANRNALARAKYLENHEQRKARCRESSRKRREADPPGMREYAREWARENRERVNELKRRRRARNRISGRAERKYRGTPEGRRAYYIANKARYAQQYREWSKRNPGKERLRANARRKGVKQATPAWADFKAMEAIYAQARLRTQLEGVMYEVDHIIPLRGVNVCGLHCESNLQILTEVENCRKRNKCL